MRVSRHMLTPQPTLHWDSFKGAEGTGAELQEGRPTLCLASWAVLGVSTCRCPVMQG